MQKPFISICIPAYNRPHYLTRLLDSIAEQSFPDFEVIITDDSPGTVVQDLLASRTDRFALKYFKNYRSFGTPENWNEGIRKASGRWLKLMHDDDWFNGPDALKGFADAGLANPGKFIFSSYNNFHEDSKRLEPVKPEAWRLQRLPGNPSILLAKNFIGPPSVIMYENEPELFYDNKLKWLVDIDFYIPLLRKSAYHHIPEALINVGISKSQVTAKVKMDGNVEIPEHFHMLQKEGIASLKDFLVFDYWWRFFRNFNIRDEAQIKAFGYEGEIHPALMSIIRAQRPIPSTILKFGPASKMLAYKSFLLSNKFL